jgi:hypothetical protein
MTDTSHRLYATVIAVVIFFLSWAAVAAQPWATTSTDPRLAVLAQREQRLRADAKLVQQVVDARTATYRQALRTRNAQIAAAEAQAAATQARSLQVAQSTPGPSSASQSAPAPSVRVVNLPPLTVTRTS